jgi:hypothetical protein
VKKSITEYDGAQIAPNTDEHGVPWCTELRCPAYDGKRCYLLGFTPSTICEPAVRVLAKGRR